MALKGKAQEFITFASGSYPCLMGLPKISERTVFGSKDPTAVVDCFKFPFNVTDGNKQKEIVVDKKKVAMRFTLTTSTEYGDSRAGLTKLIKGLFGRKLTTAEFLKIDLEKLFRTPTLVLVEETIDDDGSKYNKVVSVSAQSELNLSDYFESDVPVKLPPVTNEEDLPDPFADN